MSIRRAVLVFLIIVAVALLVYAHWWRTTEVVFVGNLLQASAIAFCGMRLNQIAFSSLGSKILWRGWACLAAGQWMWFLAQLLETYAEMILVQGSYGTIADSFWVLGSSLTLCGMLLLLKSTGTKLTFHFRTVFPLSLIALIYISAVYFAVWPHLMDAQRSLQLKILDLGYPTLDLSIAFCSCMLALMAHANKRRALMQGATIFIFAFLVAAACDVVWGYFRDASTLIYRLQDIMYFVSYGLIGLAAILFSRSVAERV